MLAVEYCCSNDDTVGKIFATSLIAAKSLTPPFARIRTILIMIHLLKYLQDAYSSESTKQEGGGLPPKFRFAACGPRSPFLPTKITLQDKDSLDIIVSEIGKLIVTLSKLIEEETKV